MPLTNYDWEKLKSSTSKITFKKLSNNYCPICKKQVSSLFQHLSENRHDSLHYLIIENQVQLIKKYFLEQNPVKQLILSKYIFAKKDYLIRKIFTKSQVNDYYGLHQITSNEINIILSLFRDLSFTHLSKSPLPSNISFHQITEIWKKHFSSDQYHYRIIFEQLQSKLNNINETINYMKLFNNYHCIFCNAQITDMSHYKTCNPDFYQEQLIKAIQVFDKLDLTNDFLTSFHLKCNLFVLYKFWEDIFSKQLVQERMLFHSPLPWRIYQNKTISQLKQLHTSFLSKQTLSQFKLSHNGVRIPRIDIDNPGFRSTWEANIARIFIYYNKHYSTEIPFDISTPSRKRTYYVDFCDHDNLFNYGKNTYIEIKGIYDNEAKEKESLFKKLYPHLKLVFIGIPKDDFHPEINYSILSQVYEHLIPMWETKSKNIYTNPKKYIPQSFLKENSISIKNNSFELLPSNCYNNIGVTTSSTSQRKSISMSLLKQMNNISPTYGYRYDIKITCHSIWHANICRIFQFHNKLYSTFVPHLLYDNQKEFILTVSFIDHDNLFNYGKDTCILLVGNLTSQVNHKINTFRKNFPNRKLITIGKYENCDIDYSILEGQYFNKILYWENKEININSTPEFFEKDVPKHLQERLKERKTIYKQCPYCKRIYQKYFEKHLKYHDKDIYHKLIETDDYDKTILKGE